MTARVIVVGSPDFADLDVMVAGLVDAWRFVGKPAQPVLVSGHNPGAGRMAEQLWALWGWQVEPQPDSNLVGLGADLLVAFPTHGDPEVHRRVDVARAAGIPVRVVVPATRRRAA